MEYVMHLMLSNNSKLLGLWLIKTIYIKLNCFLNIKFFDRKKNQTSNCGKCM